MHRERPDIIVGPLLARDLPAALGIQAATYPAAFLEGQDAFRSRIELAASYCLAARQGGELAGYLLAHGWPRQSPPPLRSALVADGTGEVLYIHDLAVSPARRGLKVGERLLERALDLATRDGLRKAELIAVEGAADYWRRLGFREEAVPDGVQEKLAGYGTQARWMTRDIPPAGERA